MALRSSSSAVTVDAREFERAMRTSTPAAVNYAVRKTLNDCAFDSRRAMIKEMEAKFDRPTPWTMKAWTVKNTSTPEEPSWEIRAKDSQAAYLIYNIEGGVRRPGDAGATRRKWLYTPVNQFLNGYGNIPTRRVATLAQEAADDRHTPGVTKSRFFFGRIGSDQKGGFGFWQRPTRRKAEVVNGKVVRKKGRRLVKPRGGLKLILHAVRQHVYKPGRLDYDGIVSNAAREAAKNFGGHLRRGQEKFPPR